MKKSTVIILLILFLLNSHLFAQRYLERAVVSITKKDLHAHVNFLASDDLKGRGTPSPELDIAGKYLKKGCVVHHINNNPQDNKLENLWVFENLSEHILSVKTLYSCFSDLIKLNQIYFKSGKYFLNRHFSYKDLSLSEIKKKIMK